MSQSAHAKKMFDDISSDEYSKSSDAVVQSPGVPVRYGDPNAIRTALLPKNRAESISTSEHVGGEAQAYVPRPVSQLQVQAEPERPEKNSREQPPGAAMVTTVEVTLPPAEAPASVVVQQETPEEAMAGQMTRAKTNATPSKPSAAAAGASSYSTPATVSKRHAERPEREAADKRHGSSAHRAKRSSASTSKEKRYMEREEVQEDVVFSTVGNRNEGRSSRHEDQREEMEVRCLPTSSTPDRRTSAVQLEFSQEVPYKDHTLHTALLDPQRSDDESEVEDFPFASYIFPRLDPALLDYEDSRTAVRGARGEDCPPNACELTLAYLMVADIRMAIYLAILFLCLFFTIVSIPTSQLDLSWSQCYTYWGFKDDCNTVIYSILRPMLKCDPIRRHLGAGAAFSIITLTLYMVNFTAATVAVFCLKHSPHKISRRSRVVVASIGAVTVVTQLISWAVIASIQSSQFCVFDDTLVYGVGFGLNLTSWVLNVVGVIVVLAVPSKAVNRCQSS
ncbi:amastin-like protein [Leptomonas seymouri]|uniref:Amastin-like protein n=1 Tax=Leptomonas seymouri TaxID=5684 RepID=A0A0N1HZU6_LEPSE|nr:amastin-like protein [Leptomonas seymouri]|eukprot:KPI88838.1 amastin-like protein [Leptomonas seymouri]